MEKKQPSYTVGRNVNWCSHYEEQYGSYNLKKLKLELPYDPAIPLMGICAGKIIIQKYTCTNTMENSMKIPLRTKHTI